MRNKLYSKTRKTSGKARKINYLAPPQASINWGLARKKRISNLGQSLGEYAIILGLLSLVAIGSLVSLSGNLNGMFDNMMSQRTNTSTTPQASMATSTSATANPLGSVLRASPTGSFASNQIGVINAKTFDLSKLPGKNVSIELAGGKSLNFNVADYKAAAESAGGLGTTINSNAVLQQLIQQLDANPDLADPATITSLKKLAAAGYEMQQFQEITQNYLATHPVNSIAERDQLLKKDSTQYFINDGVGSLTLEGMMMRLRPEGSMGFQNFDLAQFSRLFNDGVSTGPRMKGTAGTFLDILGGVRSSKLIQDNPELKALIVDTAAKQIYFSVAQTHFSSNDREVGQLAAITEDRSDLICTSSRASQCREK
jgi:Flp pilus assembly pilin Flp